MTTYHVILSVDVPDMDEADHALRVIMETIGNMADGHPDMFRSAEVIDAIDVDQ